MKTHSKEFQENITPEGAIQVLKEGNERFVKTKDGSKDFHLQLIDTAAGQFPFAIILSCIDSRVPAEIVFDQGIGDVFSTRIAGNVVNEDVLGSIEYACKVAGSKVCVVMGHTNCGAVTAACQHFEMGNVTTLLDKIKPSVEKVHPGNDNLSLDEIEEVIVANVHHSIEDIRSKSPILKEMEQNGEIKIVGAVYSVSTGIVSFL